MCELSEFGGVNCINRGRGLLGELKCVSSLIRQNKDRESD